MSTLLNTINLAESPRSGISSLGAQPFEPIAEEELAEHVMRAFGNPLDYPALSDATVPGDRVAIAVQRGVPCVKQILAGTLAALSHAGVEEERIAVLVPAGEKRLQAELQEVAGDPIVVNVHVADDSEHLALLGVTDAGEPLRLNRVLCDADLVLYLGQALGEHSGKWPTDQIFPAFSDQETLDRFRTPRNCETASQLADLAKEVEKCNWMLGLGLSLAVVPGSDGTVAQCYCGTPAAVVKHSAEIYREIWSHPSSVQGDLVVASICGDAAQQNWHALGRALSMAEELVGSNGAIALCSAIAGPLGPSLKRLLDAAELSPLEKKLKRDHFDDSCFALQLCRVLQHHTVYLASSLDPTTVERLGVAPIANDAELERLIKSHRDCLLLDHAHLLQIESDKSS